MPRRARRYCAGLALCVASFGCFEASDEPGLAGDRVLVSCEASVEESSLTLRFRNESGERLRFVLADGLPPYDVGEVGWNGTLAVTARFVCPLTYEHDCFHGETVELLPGASEERTWEWALPKELEPLRGRRSLGCTYETLREPPEARDPAASLEIRLAG